MMRTLLLAVLLCIAASSAARAQGVCTLSASGIQFGAFTGSQLAFTGTITMDCSGSGKFNYDLSFSKGGSGTYSPRKMSSGANTLSYNLYTDPALTQIWGDGTGGTIFASGKFNVPPAVHIVTNVYGLIPAQATPAQGSYSDTITATLTCTKGGNCNATTSFTVTASIQPVCTVSATNLAFGIYLGTQLDGQSQISVTCANATAWNVGLNQGTFPGATVTTRRMEGPASAALIYSLSQDAARTINWGNTVGTDTVPGVGTGSTQLLNVYGRIPASQSLAVPGTYTDTILVTLTY